MRMNSISAEILNDESLVEKLIALETVPEVYEFFKNIDPDLTFQEFLKDMEESLSSLKPLLSSDIKEKSNDDPGIQEAAGGRMKVVPSLLALLTLTSSGMTGNPAYASGTVDQMAGKGSVLESVERGSRDALTGVSNVVVDISRLASTLSISAGAATCVVKVVQGVNSAVNMFKKTTDKILGIGEVHYGEEVGLGAEREFLENEIRECWKIYKVGYKGERDVNFAPSPVDIAIVLGLFSIGADNLSPRSEKSAAGNKDSVEALKDELRECYKSLNFSGEQTQKDLYLKSYEFLTRVLTVGSNKDYNKLFAEKWSNVIKAQYAEAGGFSVTNVALGTLKVAASAVFGSRAGKAAAESLKEIVVDGQAIRDVMPDNLISSIAVEAKLQQTGSFSDRQVVLRAAILALLRFQKMNRFGEHGGINALKTHYSTQLIMRKYGKPLTSNETAVANIVSESVKNILVKK